MLPFFHIKIESPSSLSPSNNYHISLSQPNVWEETPSIAGLTFSRPTHSSLTACHPAGTHLQSLSCHSQGVCSCPALPTTLDCVWGVMCGVPIGLALG